MKALRYLVKLLILIGALNWGLVGFFQYDLVANIFGGMMSMGARVAYAVIGLAGLLGVWSFIKCCCCSSSCSCGPNCNCSCKKNNSHNH